MKKIIRVVFGSYMYGCDTPNSDRDFKGIYLPELDDFLLQRVKSTIKHSTGNNFSKNTKDDIDDEWMSLNEFLRLAIKGETIALDMLHSDSKFWELNPKYGQIWLDLVNNRSKFYTKNLKAYMGYVKRQAAKYGIKGSRMAAVKLALSILKQFDLTDKLKQHWDQLPEQEFLKKTKIDGYDFYHVNGKNYGNTVTVEYAIDRLNQMYNNYGERAKQAERNEGIDWKACHHALRAGYQLKSILENGTFSYPLPETDFLMQVKYGKLNFTSQVSPILEQLIEDIDILNDASMLPESVDTNFWNDWLLNTLKTNLIQKE